MIQCHKNSHRPCSSYKNYGSSKPQGNPFFFNSSLFSSASQALAIFWLFALSDSLIIGASIPCLLLCSHCCLKASQVKKIPRKVSSQMLFVGTESYSSYLFKRYAPLRGLSLSGSYLAKPILLQKTSFFFSSLSLYARNRPHSTYNSMGWAYQFFSSFFSEDPTNCLLPTSSAYCYRPLFLPNSIPQNPLVLFLSAFAFRGDSFSCDKSLFENSLLAI